MGVPTSPLCGEEGLGDELRRETVQEACRHWRLSRRDGFLLERCRAGLVGCRCHANPMRLWPNGQEQCGVGSLGFQLLKLRIVVWWSCGQVSPLWAAGCPEVLRDPARLQVCESALRSLFSGEA